MLWIDVYNLAVIKDKGVFPTAFYYNVKVYCFDICCEILTYACICRHWKDQRHLDTVSWSNTYCVFIYFGPLVSESKNLLNMRS